MITRTHTNQKRRGFTLTELLVVIAIITLLLAIGSIGITAGRRSARNAAALQHLTRIEQACEAFKGDFNDYPPLVSKIDGSNAMTRPDYQRPGETSAVVRQRLQDQRYSSIYSLAVCLVGVGDLNDDGVQNYGESDALNEDDGVDGPGFRAIGADRFWGLAQNPMRDAVSNSGRVYGPYLDPADLGDLLDGERETTNGPILRYVINDLNGEPIRYYRYWPIKDSAGRASLKRIPAELRSAESLAAAKAGDDDRANELDRGLLGAEFAILSAGYDGQTGDNSHPTNQLDQDLDLSNNATYSALRRSIEDNLRVLK